MFFGGKVGSTMCGFSMARKKSRMRSILQLSVPEPAVLSVFLTCRAPYVQYVQTAGVAI